jgi:predicted phosphodiesterase
VRYLVVSDIHANRPALEAVLADAEPRQCDAVLCLGDVVGYGAHPRETLTATLALAPAAVVRGNHDRVCAGLAPATSFNDSARAAAEWTYAALDVDERARLAALPRGPVIVDASLEICHGAPFDEDYYLFDGFDAERAMQAASGRICLFGHTHQPALYVAGAPRFQRSRRLTGVVPLPDTAKVLVNVGAVGQPRDGDARAAYGVLDTAANTVEFCRVNYDVAAAQRAIRDAGLPEWLAVRLSRGE